MDLMTPTDHHTFCPYKGTASYWTIAVGDKIAENVVWGYREPFDEVPALKDFVAFYWNRVDALVRGGRGDLRPPARPL